MVTEAAPLDVDIVSDVVCPWCFIGLVRVEQALAKAGIADARITFHPFELDPSVPKEGVDLRERLTKKYGVPAESMFERVEHAARESGIPLDFAKVRRSPNTLSAHVLLGAAKSRGTQHELARALFDAHFLEGRDIGDPAVLGAIAARHGFTEDEAIALLADDDAREATRRETRELAAQGISGVPFVILGGKLAVSGAQSVDTFVAAIDRARSMGDGA